MRISLRSKQHATAAAVVAEEWSAQEAATAAAYAVASWANAGVRRPAKAAPWSLESDLPKSKPLDPLASALESSPRVADDFHLEAGHRLLKETAAHCDEDQTSPLQAEKEEQPEPLHADRQPVSESHKVQSHSFGALEVEGPAALHCDCSYLEDRS